MFIPKWDSAHQFVHLFLEYPLGIYSLKRTFMKTLLSSLLALTSFISLSQIEPAWTRYPSISPDGSKIAFSYKGDIYVVPSTGGTAIAITSHPAYDFSPVWSDDGKKIAFASDRYGNFDVFLMTAGGTNTKRLTFHSVNDIPWSFAQNDAKILFSSLRYDKVESALFPTGILSELYSVPTAGGRIKQELGIPAEHANISPDGKTLVYQDRKGYENPWRKHHTSGVTRDIWTYDMVSKKHEKYAGWAGEDRNPVITTKSIYFLSEREGSVMNVWKGDYEGNIEQVTSFQNHPVRFLSASKQEDLCFFYDGYIYTKKNGEEPKKVNILIGADEKNNGVIKTAVKSKPSEIALSPNGKELAFVVRGEVYVTSIDHVSTKRITDTPEQERNVSFSPDGKKIIYASERNGSWNIYETNIKSENEDYFFLSTVLSEKPLVETEDETFQPQYSPDGKEIAYLKERTGIHIKNLTSGKIRTILQERINYSYSDGDQWFQWSPDGKWITTQYIDNNRWMTDVAIIPSNGEGTPINLTESGYSEAVPMWANKGNTILFFSDRHGKRSQASWGADADVYAAHLNQKTYDKFNLTQEEYEILYNDKKKDGDSGKEDKETKSEDIVVETENIEDRIKRLTIHSSNLSGATLSPKGDKLYYLSKFEKGYDLWSHDLIKKETKLILKLNGNAGALEMDKNGESLFVIDAGKIYKIDLKEGKANKKPVSFRSYMNLKPYEERHYIFEHTWKQVEEKFYLKDLHEVDWDFMKSEYEEFLPHIDNGYDFSELLSEMLGELNASHTGARFRARHPNPDQTASLGLIYDHSYTGDGLKVAEIISRGPFDKAGSKVVPGSIITAINGEKITATDNYNRLLNNITGLPTQLEIRKGEKDKTTWTETIRPVSFGSEYNLLYDRWVKRNEKFTEEYSKGKIAYVHVRGMNESSFRNVYSKLMGKYHDYEAVVVDTRFNGGGWLHDDLATFLSGEKYMIFSPRGQENMGSEPMFKWKQPSVVLMSEGNYSDAHMFPYVYKALKIGKLIGMPVAGTGTAVWWEQQIDGLTVFGIPQVGMRGIDGKYLENQDLNPDIRVENDPHTVVTGEDKQLKTAIDELLITKGRDH